MICRLFMLLLASCAALLAPIPAGAENAPTAPPDGALCCLKVELFLAQNTGVRNDVDDSHPLRKRFDKLFGYKAYELVGSNSCSMADQGTFELLPSKNFSIRVQRPSTTKPDLLFELFQNGKPMFQGTFVPKKYCPLIIKGPYYDRGELVMAITASRKDAAK
jgi:hypothetical protein